MKANFKQLQVEVAFDEYELVDITKSLGNFLHANTNDIGLDDVAREIYHSEGELEIPNDYIEMIESLVMNPQCPLLAAFKRAIVNELKKE